jgi:molecular chaperone HtpG
MEINPKHPLILNLLQIYQKDVNDEFMARIVSRLFDSILWLDGYLEDPHATAIGLQEILAESAKLYMQQK